VIAEPERETFAKGPQADRSDDATAGSMPLDLDKPEVKRQVHTPGAETLPDGEVGPPVIPQIASAEATLPLQRQTVISISRKELHAVVARCGQSGLPGSTQVGLPA
jgi:hypothetical protein